MSGEYTAAAVVAPVVVVGIEVILLRTGLFRELRYWATVAIVLAFQIIVDGWLTRADATVVYYHPDAVSGVRWPWNIPIEDFGFGFALVTATLLAWRWLRPSPEHDHA